VVWAVGCCLKHVCMCRGRGECCKLTLGPNSGVRQSLGMYYGGKNFVPGMQLKQGPDRIQRRTSRRRKRGPFPLPLALPGRPAGAQRWLDLPACLPITETGWLVCALSGRLWTALVVVVVVCGGKFCRHRLSCRVV
jgi:hypothetical protein